MPRDEGGDVIEGADEDEDEGGSEGNEHEQEQQTNEQQATEPGPQPLGPSSSMALKALIKDYDEGLLSVDATRQIISDAAVEWAAVTQNPGKKGDLLDRDYRELIDTEEEMRTRREALKAISNAVASGQAVFDAVEQYKIQVKRALTAYHQKTMRQKYLNHKGYNDFHQCVWEAWNDEAMPPLQDRFPAEVGDEDEDDDIAVGGVKEDFKCPLTMALLDCPVTSAGCGHSYSKDAISGYLEQCQRRRERPQCPRAGCEKTISASTLRDDRDLEKRVRRHKRRLEQREEQRRTQVSAVID